jgi:adenine/guanine phosphoribosyltransferase-like PRPP-binding protein
MTAGKTARGILRMVGAAAASLVRVIVAVSIGLSGRAPEPVRPTDPPKPYRP